MMADNNDNINDPDIEELERGLISQMSRIIEIERINRKKYSIFWPLVKKYRHKRLVKNLVWTKMCPLCISNIMMPKAECCDDCKVIKPLR